MRITDTVVKSLSSSTQKTHYDDALPNFGIRIGKRRKTWVVLKGPERERITIGHYPALPLKHARVKAVQILSAPDDSSVTFRAALDQFCEIHLSKLRPSSAREAERLIRAHFSHLYTVRMGQITPLDVAPVLDGMRNRPTTANCAHGAIRTLFSWAASRSMIPANPLQYLKAPYAKNKRDRVLTDEEITLIWQNSFNHQHFGQLVRLLILSGQRLKSNCFIKAQLDT